MKSTYAIVLAGFVGLILAISSTFFWNSHKSAVGAVTIHASWTSNATTIEDVSKEADVVVRVQVRNIYPTRILEQTLQPDSRGTGGEPFVDRVPFTDSDMLVLDVYKGDVVAGQSITVMQVGGTMTSGDQELPTIFNVEDDPVYIDGSEHILFLTDISGDSIHAPTRQLYRIINSAGRYDIQGAQVTSPYHTLADVDTDQDSAVSSQQENPSQPTEEPLALPTEEPLDTSTELPAETSRETSEDKPSEDTFIPPTTVDDLVQDIRTSLAS